MRPAEAREWIARREILGMRFGTERMRALLAALGRPERHAPALHVVGTNGKSSTTRLAAAALGASGARTGAYLSPHITDWRERIQVDGRSIDERRFAAAVSEVRAAAEALDLPEGDAVTQFEALTAAAFVALRAEAVDVLVVEAGLGGRYDATNVLPDAAVVLTNVSLDHTELLGDSERAIAGEKLAVCPDGHRRLVIGPCSPVAEAAVRAECAARGLVPEWVGRDITVTRSADGLRVTTPRGRYEGITLAVAGEFQEGNLAAALAGAELVAGRMLPDAHAVVRAVGRVTMPGRLEMVPGTPAILLDGAHNPAGVSALAGALPALTGGRRPRVGLMSVLGDKDIVAMVGALAPHLDVVVATGSHHPRALPADAVAAIARAAGLATEALDEPDAAIARARALAGPGGIVIVAGSLYLLADLRPRLVS